MASQYLAKQESLTKVADAIRVKSKKTGSLSFPDGFVDGIQNAGANVTVDGVAIDGELNLKSDTVNVTLPDLPPSSLYKYPYSFKEITGFVILENKTHIFFSLKTSDDTYYYHYESSDNETWVKKAYPVTESRYNSYEMTNCFIFNNKINAIIRYWGADNIIDHLVYNEEKDSWESIISTYTSDTKKDNGFYCDGQNLYSYVTNNSNFMFYKYDNNNWSYIDSYARNSNNYFYYLAAMVLFNNELHLFSYEGGSSPHYKHFKAKNGTLVEASTLPSNLPGSTAMFTVYDNKIYAFCGASAYDNAAYYGYKYYMFDGFTWIEGDILPYTFNQGKIFVSDNGIHLVGSKLAGNTGIGYTPNFSQKHAIVDKKIYVED